MKDISGNPAAQQSQGARLPDLVTVGEMVKAVKAMRREKLFTPAQEAEALQLLGYAGVLYLGALAHSVTQFAGQVQAINAQAAAAKKEADAQVFASSPTETL